MKRLAFLPLGLILAFTGAAALAQEAADSDTAVTPVDDVLITGSHPEGEAVESGEVELQCEILRDGRVTNCIVLREQPSGAGFGQAALDAAARARLAPQENWRRGMTARFTTRFRLGE